MTLQARLILDNLKWTLDDMRDYQEGEIMADDLNAMENHLELLETELRRKT